MLTYDVLAAQSGQTDSTFAVVAVLVTGTVGIAGPIILSFAAARRQRSEQTALDDRQQRELSDARARENRDARRLVLEEGAVTLVEFRNTLMELKLVESEAGPLTIPPHWDSFTGDLAVHRGRLLLWFAPAHDIVRSFDAVNSAIIKLWRATLAARGADSDGEKRRDDRISQARTEFDLGRARYLAAARHYLTDEPEPEPEPESNATRDTGPPRTHPLDDVQAPSS